MGDLSRREIERDKAIDGLFSHHGDGQQGRKRGPQGPIGKAVCLMGARPGRRLPATITPMVAASRPDGQLDPVLDISCDHLVTMLKN
jgi:hypothetical protein